MTLPSGLPTQGSRRRPWTGMWNAVAPLKTWWPRSSVDVRNSGKRSSTRFAWMHGQGGMNSLRSGSHSLWSLTAGSLSGSVCVPRRTTVDVLSRDTASRSIDRDRGVAGMHLVRHRTRRAIREGRGTIRLDSCQRPGARDRRGGTSRGDRCWRPLHRCLRFGDRRGVSAFESGSSPASGRWLGICPVGVSARHAARCLAVSDKESHHRWTVRCGPRR